MEASALKKALNDVCWNEEDECYYNVDRETRDQYRRIGYSTFVPLMYKMAPEAGGKEMIRRYMLSDEHMRSPMDSEASQKAM